MHVDRRLPPRMAGRESIQPLLDGQQVANGIPVREGHVLDASTGTNPKAQIPRPTPQEPIAAKTATFARGFAAWDLGLGTKDFFASNLRESFIYGFRAFSFLCFYLYNLKICWTYTGKRQPSLDSLNQSSRINPTW